MAKKVTVKASSVYAHQNKLLHRGFVAAGMPYKEYKDDWLGVASSLAKRPIAGLSEMTLHERNRLLVYISRRGVKLFTPSIPADMRDWKKGDGEKTQNYTQSDDRQIRYAEAVWANMGYRRKTLYGLCLKRFGKAHPEWLEPDELNLLVNIVCQKAKSKGMLDYHGGKREGMMERYLIKAGDLGFTRDAAHDKRLTHLEKHVLRDPMGGPFRRRQQNTGG